MEVISEFEGILIEVIKEVNMITKITCLGILILSVASMYTVYSQSPLLFINFTAIGETVVSTNPIVTLIEAVVGSILVIATLAGKINGYLQRRGWNKKYGESRTPVVINASDS